MLKVRGAFHLRSASLEANHFVDARLQLLSSLCYLGWLGSSWFEVGGLRLEATPY